jgi:phosphatidylinositol-3-phosphatase
MFFTLLIVALAVSNPVAATQAFGHSDAGRPFNYVVVIVLENQGLGDIINSSIAPFMNQLASSYGLAVNYTAIAHPSLPNYLALLSGQDFTSWSTADCNPGPGCFAGNAANLVDRLETHGLTWKAYMEDYPSSCGSQCSSGGCFMGDKGTDAYAARHDPFVYFSDIVNSTTRCSNIVPANSGGQGGPDDLLLSDLSSPSTASNLMWLTPNLCDDMHDACKGPSNQTDVGSCGAASQCVPQGDSYLEHLVPKILSSNLFTHQKAALFITFDEGNGYCPLNGSSADCVYAVWAGPTVKTSFKSTSSFSHYSFLSTLETVWHLSPLTSNDAKATPMTTFFVVHHNHREHNHDHHRDHDEHLESKDGHGSGKRGSPFDNDR